MTHNNAAMLVKKNHPDYWNGKCSKYKHRLLLGKKQIFQFFNFTFNHNACTRNYN